MANGRRNSQKTIRNDFLNVQGNGGQYGEHLTGAAILCLEHKGAWSNEISPAYSTAMVILAFTVPYRQLPIYQRDETVNEDED